MNNLFLAFFLYESDVNMYIKCLSMFPFLTSWNKFTGTPTEVPLDCPVMRAEGKHMKQITAENIKRVQLSNDVCTEGHRD